MVLLRNRQKRVLRMSSTHIISLPSAEKSRLFVASAKRSYKTHGMAVSDAVPFNPPGRFRASDSSMDLVLA